MVISRIGLNYTFKAPSTVPATMKGLSICLLLHLRDKKIKCSIKRIKICDRTDIEIKNKLITRGEGKGTIGGKDGKGHQGTCIKDVYKAKGG